MSTRDEMKEHIVIAAIDLIKCDTDDNHRKLKIAVKNFILIFASKAKCFRPWRGFMVWWRS